MPESKNAFFGVEHQAEQGRDEKQGKYSRDSEPTNHYTPKTPVEFGSSSRKENQGHHPEDARRGGHENGPHPFLNGLMNGVPGFHPLSHVVQGLVNDEDGVIDDDADENDEAQHGEDIPGLKGDEAIHQE